MSSKIEREFFPFSIIIVSSLNRDNMTKDNDYDIEGMNLHIPTEITVHLICRCWGFLRVLNITLGIIILKQEKTIHLANIESQKIPLS